MKKLAILGTGTLADRIAIVARQTKQYNVVGLINKEGYKGLFCRDLPVIGTDDDVLSLYNDGYIDCIQIAVGYTLFKVREKLFNRFYGQVPLATIVHPSSFVDENAVIGEGCVIFPSCSVGPYAKLKENVLLNTSVTICHNSIIKRHSYISPGCNIAGTIGVGERCMIGVGTTIIDHVHICNDVITGGGSVIISDITTPGTYVGVPARKVK
ncbi:MAG: hypothetical protein LBN06_08960 [Prevotellaceae bacterium]|jgi:sugar O-acyltransferase (sialic acid O-acetyltransferase NeuD family)|nr:hypothetical protein [Prevotellaceae bacterium]